MMRFAFAIAIAITVGVSDAHADDMPTLGAFVGVKDATASSTFVDKAKKDSYAAWRTIDFDLLEAKKGNIAVPPTAWCEGKPDQGLGETLTYTLAAPTKIDELKIAAGVWLTQKLFDANNRVTALSVSLDGGPAIKVTPTTKREWATVKVGKAVTTIKLTIDAVTKGKMNDSCISGVQIFVGGEAQAVARGMDGAAMAALPAAYAAILKALSAPKRAGIDKVVAFPFSYSSSDTFEMPTMTYANAKELVSACVDEPPACPSLPLTIAKGVTTIGSSGPGILEIWLPSVTDINDRWHLVWKGGAWKLTAIDYE